MGKDSNQDRHMNKIIAIGYTGQKRCYLNISREEAVSRYLNSEGIKQGLGDEKIDEFEFDTEFAGYDVWESEDLPRHGFLINISQ
jgi:hypothetical protein